MDKKEKYAHWLNIAQYDLDTADIMFDSGRYLYVAFTCQQAIEKLTKGIYVYHFDKEAKYTHNILLVLKEIESIANLDKYAEYEELFAILSGYYLVGRYDAYKQELLKELNKNAAQKLLNETKEAFAWLKSQVKL
ncbi:MAG: HEPN domain-containing protein [Leptospirales bacterium]|nr:HEPN domain-containing protein [Leptospirales bacterium]